VSLGFIRSHAITLFELPGLFPYVGRKSWHVLVEGAVGNVRVCQRGHRVFSFTFRCNGLNRLFSLAISPLQFGRPADWPVSLQGQGE